MAYAHKKWAAHARLAVPPIIPRKKAFLLSLAHYQHLVTFVATPITATPASAAAFIGIVAVIARVIAVIAAPATPGGRGLETITGETCACHE
jgi:hypothetical protein